MKKSNRLYAYVEDDFKNKNRLKQHYDEVKFAKEYYEKYQRPWIGYYPRKNLTAYMWGKKIIYFIIILLLLFLLKYIYINFFFFIDADFIGQKHVVESDHGLLDSIDDTPKKKKFELEVVSTHPKVFLIKNLFSEFEAEHIISLGKNFRRSGVGAQTEKGYGKLFN